MTVQLSTLLRRVPGGAGNAHLQPAEEELWPLRVELRVDWIAREPSNVLIHTALEYGLS